MNREPQIYLIGLVCRCVRGPLKHGWTKKELRDRIMAHHHMHAQQTFNEVESSLWSPRLCKASLLSITPWIL